MTYPIGDFPPWNPYYPWQYPTYVYTTGNSLGWECPKCHATYNPVIMQCYNCKGEEQEEKDA